MWGRNWELAHVAACTDIRSDKRHEDVHFPMHVWTNDKHTHTHRRPKCFVFLIENHISITFGKGKGLL